MPEEAGAAADPLGFAVEGRFGRVAVDVEGLVRFLVEGDPGAADCLPELVAGLVATDHDRADVVVLAAVGPPLLGGVDPAGREDAEGPLAVTVGGDEDHPPGEPASALAAAVEAVGGGDDDALVAGAHGGPRAAAVAEDPEGEEERAV